MVLTLDFSFSFSLSAYDEVDWSPEVIWSCRSCATRSKLVSGTKRIWATRIKPKRARLIQKM